MYAIVDIAGRQYKVEKGLKLYVPLMKAEAGQSITLDRVLLSADGDKVQVGVPALSGASVTAKVLGHVKGDKVIVFKKKRRKGYRVKRGHRQPYTQISIEALSL